MQKQHLDQLPDILRDEPRAIQAHAVKPGGVTVDHALHTWTLSLTQLRRLRFPVDGEHDEQRNQAARAVLAALGLYALALQQERGCWLRSRCELIPESNATLELVGGGNGEDTSTLGRAEDVRRNLLDAALGAATEEHKLDWGKSVIRLMPTQKLADLVAASDALTPDAGTQGEEETDAGSES